MRRPGLCLLLAACATAQAELPPPSAAQTVVEVEPPAKAVPVPAAAPAAPAAPELRLPDLARPLHYSVELTVIPEKETFKGSIEIELEVKTTTDLLWLNARHLRIGNAS